jgi:membrane-associated phospholipid phosphatase
MRAARALFAVAASAGLLSLADVARAEPRVDPEQVEWSPTWPRVKWWEVTAAVALTFGDTLFEDRAPLPTHASWNSPILFDTWARDTFRGRTAALQAFASTTSDILYKAGALVPFLVDDYFAATSVHLNAEVGWQLAAIDLQSYGIAGLISLSAEHAVGRARPYTESCVNGYVFDGQGHLMQTCGTGNDYRSFFSGHTTATGTAAGLVCVHHQHLPLFGGGFADLAPCLFMIGLSATTGVLRLVYDEHWASDLIVGWATGVFSGYVLPSIMHFGFGSGRPLGEVHSGSLDFVPTFLPAPGGGELGAVGVF